MYTRRIFSPLTLARWTRYESAVFVLLAMVPVVLHEFLGLRWLYVPWLPVALVGTAVAFVLGFQNNATYDRIWEARKIWGAIVNTSRRFGIMARDFVTADFAAEPVSADELDAVRRRLVLRHVAWLTALRHAMRQPRPWEHLARSRTNREWIQRIGVRERVHSLEEDLADYLSAEELAAVLARTNPAAQILGLQSGDLRELRSKGWIDDFRHLELERTLGGLFDAQGKSERIKNFPYPRQYATLNTVFVWIFLFLLPFGLVHEFETLGASMLEEFPLMGSRFIWLSIPFSSIVMWIFHTMERIGRTGENPFEGSPNDVPISTIARGIEIDLRELLGEDPATIPAPFEARFGTQT